MDWARSGIEYLRENWVEFAARVGVSIVILGLAFVIGGIAGRYAARVLRRKGPRAATLASVVQTGLRTTVLFLGVLMAVDHLGIDVKTLLAGAGIVGLAVGFGAQSLVKDMITGFFLIYEGALAEGDIAKVGEATGVVEHVGLRMTRVRTFNGQLFYIPNGNIDVVGNWTREWTRAVVEVGVAYEQDVSNALDVLARVGKQWADENEELVLEEPVAEGLLGFGGSDVTLRLVIKVRAGQHWAIERELRKRVKAAFDEENVEIPFPRQVVYHRQGGGDGALVVQTEPAPASD
jgi:moderate conductance mechanosensitive channel